MNMSIMLVDDEAGIRNVLGISLADRGYDVHTASSAQQALEAFARHQPAILLTDIKMPGMDGIELLRAVKKRHPDTEVIMITGHGDVGLAIKSLKYEATDFITKPIDEEILDVALKRATERIAMRAELRAYTENLETLVEEKSRRLIQAERLAAMGETVAGLAHAIKNIAGSLRGGAFVVEKGLSLDNPDYLHQGWEMVKGNVERIQQLSLDMLNIAKPDSAAFQRMDPRIPLQEVYDLMQPQAEHFEVDLKVIHPETIDTVDMDPEGIHRCLMNLVSNAMDACTHASLPGRKGRIHMELKPWNHGIEYSICDNGQGMSKDLQGRLFEGFVTTKGSRGTGIGLMLVRKIIEAHQGSVAVESHPGQGSCFTVRIPAQKR
jgi:signal transduction histidine kinase